MQWKKCQFRFINVPGICEKHFSPEINFHQHFPLSVSGSHFNLLQNLIQFCTFFYPVGPFDNILRNCVNMYRDAVHCQTSSEPTGRWESGSGWKGWKRWETSFFLMSWCRWWKSKIIICCWAKGFFALVLMDRPKTKKREISTHRRAKTKTPRK